MLDFRIEIQDLKSFIGVPRLPVWACPYGLARMSLPVRGLPVWGLPVWRVLKSISSLVLTRPV